LWLTHQYHANVTEGRGHQQGVILPEVQHSAGIGNTGVSGKYVSFVSPGIFSKQQANNNSLCTRTINSLTLAQACLMSKACAAST